MDEGLRLVARGPGGADGVLDAGVRPDSDQHHHGSSNG